MPDKPGLREQKKATTRATIQAHAMRLFLAHGFDATTVEMIAEAANVSQMTCFRHFPTKEAMVLSDPYDPVIAAFVGSEPATLTAFERIRNGVLKAIGQISSDESRLVRERTGLVMRTPQLRARYWEQQTATCAVLVRALGGPLAGEDDYRLQVVASACLGAMTAAVEFWARQGNAADLGDVMERAFAVLRADVA
jgi:AcrR family transcriptional regulator